MWKRSLAARLLPAHSRVLDVGCGDAESSLPGWIGMDGDRRALTRAASRGVRGIVVDVELPWPVRDRCLNAVVLFDVLEHVPDPRWLLAETKRVLSDGGVVLVALPNAAHAVNRVTALAGRTSDFTDAAHRTGSPVSDHLHRFSAESGSRLLTDMGFSIDERHEYFPGAFSEGWWRALSPVARAVLATGLHRRLPNLLAYEFLYLCHVR